MKTLHLRHRHGLNGESSLHGRNVHGESLRGGSRHPSGIGPLSGICPVWVYALLLCALSTTGCTKGETVGAEPQLCDVPILMQSSVGRGLEVEVQNKTRNKHTTQGRDSTGIQLGIRAKTVSQQTGPQGGSELSSQASSQASSQTGSQTRVPIDGGTATSAALALSVVRADQTTGPGDTYGSYSVVAIAGTRAEAVGNTPTALTLAPVQYYPANGRGTRLTGWHPQAGVANGVTYAAGVVTFTFDGSRDIMTAPMVQGKSTDVTPPNLAFAHRLAQVRVWIYADESRAQTAWGKVKSIKILNQRTVCTYTPAADAATGNVVFAGEAATPLTVYSNAIGIDPPVGLATAAVHVGDNVMIEPQNEATYVLTIEIAADGAGTKPLQVSLNPQTFEPSKAYNIYLKLTTKDIVPTATISDWGTPTDSDVQL